VRFGPIDRALRYTTSKIGLMGKVCLIGAGPGAADLDQAVMEYLKRPSVFVSMEVPDAQRSQSPLGHATLR